MDKFYVLFFLLTFPAMIGITRYLLQLIHLWQVKEYRVDRLLSHLRFEKKYDNLGTVLWLTKLALLIIGILYVFKPGAGYLSFALVITYILYFLHLEWFLMELFHKRLIRPRIKSPRNIIIAFTVFIFISSIFGRIILWFMQFDFANISFGSEEGLTVNEILRTFEPTIIEDQPVIPIFNLVVALLLNISLFIDLLLPFWVFIMVIVTSPLAYITRKRKILSAMKIIKERGNEMKVVAITGSYGKTTTKELIYEILKDNFVVSKTPENNNTAVGLAQAVKKYVNNNTQILVAEMGAYKKGEIKESTQIAPPDIAVVTALTQQHLSLFGSLDKLYQAKFEIINGLKDDGVAIFNGDDERCQTMSRETMKSKVFFYKKQIAELPNHKFGMSTQNSGQHDNNLYLTKVVDIGDFLDIEISYKGQNYNFKVALKDERYSLNLAAAIMVGLQLGMTMDEIINRISSWSYSLEYLKDYAGLNDSIIIDDGKSSNKEGFLLALEYLKRKHEGNKWVMTQGIIELGNERQVVYQEIAKKIIEVTNGLITNDSDLIMAVKQMNPDFQVLKINQIEGFVDAYKYNIKKGDKILLEGSFPADVLNKIIDNAVQTNQ